MTARAIYSYFPTRDALITALISGIATSLAEAVEAAGDAVPDTDPGGRLMAWGKALREWALAHPERLPALQQKGYRYERDKFRAAELSETASEKVSPPRVAQCPVQLEAVVERVHPFGEEGSGVVAVETRVIRVHVEEALLVPDNHRHIDADRWDPLIMKFCELYGNGQNLHPSELATAWGIVGPTGAVAGG